MIASVCLDGDVVSSGIFFFNDTATTEIYTLSLHDALPISGSDEFSPRKRMASRMSSGPVEQLRPMTSTRSASSVARTAEMSRSEEHTSELQSRQYLVCRLLLEKKKNRIYQTAYPRTHRLTT